MKTEMKRVSCVLLAGVLLVSGVPALALADGDTLQVETTAAESSTAEDSTTTGSTSEDSTDASASDSTDSTDVAKEAENISTASKTGKWEYKESGKKKVKVSYRYKDGTYPTTITRIGKSVYYFNSATGELKTSTAKKRLVKVDGKRFVVDKRGKLLSKWQVVGSKLYYLGGKYLSARTSRTIDSIKLSSSGAAKKNLNSSLRVQCIKMLEKVSNRSKKRSKQLRDAWRYITSKKHFDYDVVPVNIKNKSWAKRFAYQMFKTHAGNCYGFAALFGCVADFLGYKVVMVTCRVPGSRDHAADGFTRHGLLTINGRYYDPEADFAGWCNGVYGAKHYPISTKARKYKKYKSFVGTGLARGINKCLGSSTKLSVKKKGSSYYGCSSATGKRSRKLSGLYCIKGKLYKFSHKGKMGVSAFNKLKAASAHKARWTELKKLIGNASKVTSMASCYQPGTNYLRQYKHVYVSTFRPADGGSEIVISYSAR
ncbi:MAG: hypothetical protein ACOX69_06945 [Coriobacteriales bacterium]